MRTIVDDHGVTSRPGDTGLEVHGELVVQGTSVLGELAELKRVVAQLQELLNPTPQPFQTFLPPSMAAQLPEEHDAYVRAKLENSAPRVEVHFPVEEVAVVVEEPAAVLETPPTPAPAAKPVTGKNGAAKSAKASK